MTTPLPCPMCGADEWDESHGIPPLGRHVRSLRCMNCGLTGSREVLANLEQRLVSAHKNQAALEAEIARLKTPECVLGEAERLLREACSRSGYVEVCLHGNVASISDRYDGSDETDGDNLADALKNYSAREVPSDD